MFIRLLVLVGGLLLGGLAWGQLASPTAAAGPGSRGPGGAATPATQPRAEAVAWGWHAPVPGNLPNHQVQAMPPARPHVAYCDYRATARGQLVAAAGPPAPQIAAARRRSPGTPVLLRLHYQEPATGPSLLDPGQEPARQALADTLARQLATTQADGLGLAIQLRPPGPPAAPVARPLTATERTRLLRDLNQQRRALNAEGSKLAHDSTGLRLRLRAARSPAGRAQGQQQLAELRQRAADFRQRRAVYRRSLQRVQHGLPPVASASALDQPIHDNRLGLQSFIKLLGLKLRAYRPAAKLTVTLPLRDSTRQYASLAGLASTIDAFVLSLPSAADPEVQSGLLQQLRLAAQQYQLAGIPARQLRLEHSHPGPPQAAARGGAPTARPAPVLATPGAPAHLPGWAHLVLFAAALLVGFACFGLVLSTLLRASAIIPFRRHLLRVGGLLGVGLLLLLGYGYLLGPHGGRPLLHTCLLGLGLLGAGLLYHRLRQPSQLP